MSKDEVYMRNTRSYARTEEKLKLFGCEPVPENEEVNYNISLCSSILMTILMIRIRLACDTLFARATQLLTELDKVILSEIKKHLQMHVCWLYLKLKEQAERLVEGNASSRYVRCMSYELKESSVGLLITSKLINTSRTRLHGL